MLKITVYSFEVFNKEQGVFITAKGMASKETIDELENETRILDESVEVDVSELCHSGRYYALDSEANFNKKSQ